MRDPTTEGPFDDIRIWRPHMSKIAGVPDVQFKDMREPYGLSIEISKDDETWDHRSKLPIDAWCNWLSIEHLRHISDLPSDFHIVNGFLIFWKYNIFRIVLLDPQYLLGSSIKIGGYELHDIFVFYTDVALTEHVRLHLTFDSDDLQSTDIKTLMRNIDQSVRGWIDQRRSALLIHETPWICPDK